MSKFEPTIDAAYREYADLELRYHHLLMEGKENGLEAVAAEAQMEELWEKLDVIQRQSLSGRGSDLNWVRRKGEPPPMGRKIAEEVTPTEQQHLVEAIGSEEWHKTLHYLRLCAPIFPIDGLAYLRGSVYEELGLLTFAGIFYEMAADLDPANADKGLSDLSTIVSTYCKGITVGWHSS